MTWNAHIVVKLWPDWRGSGTHLRFQNAQSGLYLLYAKRYACKFLSEIKRTWVKRSHKWPKQGRKYRKEKWNTNLFTNCGETIQELNCMYNKLVEIGNDFSLLYSRNLRETQTAKLLSHNVDRRERIQSEKHREIDVIGIFHFCTFTLKLHTDHLKNTCWAFTINIIKTFFSYSFHNWLQIKNIRFFKSNWNTEHTPTILQHQGWANVILRSFICIHIEKWAIKIKILQKTTYLTEIQFKLTILTLSKSRRPNC